MHEFTPFPSRAIRPVPRELPRRDVITLDDAAGLLFAARIALPFVLERLVNDRLARVQGYDGSVPI